MLTSSQELNSGTWGLTLLQRGREIVTRFTDKFRYDAARIWETKQAGQC